MLLSGQNLTECYVIKFHTLESVAENQVVNIVSTEMKDTEGAVWFSFFQGVNVRKCGYFVISV